MAISPDQWESLALDIRNLYIKVSDEITKEIVKRTLSGIHTPDYLIRKQQDLVVVRKKIEKLIQELSVRMGREVEDIVQQAYYAGTLSADEDIKGIIKHVERISGGVDRTITLQQAIAAGFATIDRRVVTVIVGALKQKLTDSHLMILRSTNDAYRRIIGQVAAESLAGSGTRLQAAQKALNRFADQGITGFTTKNGSRWEIETYAEMATRSAIGQATIEGHIDRQRSYQRIAERYDLNLQLDLYYVSNNPEECEKCRPWEGRVLSENLSTEYPTIQEARDAGLFHPRCGHRLHTYVPDVTPKPPKAKPDPNGYKERQHQRYLERQIRFWKKRQLVAATPEAQKLANAKVREWQSRMREWINEKDRYRRYERESISGAR